jgi:hypothetical protein
MDLADVHRVLHAMTADYTFFSAAHEAFSKIDHILGYKPKHNKYKKYSNNPLYPNRYSWNKIRNQ